MIEIKNLLLRFQNVLLSEDIKKETIRDIISRAINLDLSREDIEIKNNIVYLNIKPIYKNEIFIKKDQILNELNKSLGVKTPGDLR